MRDLKLESSRPMGVHSYAVVERERVDTGGRINEAIGRKTARTKEGAER